MSPYFNAETGELRDPDLYADVPDASAPPLKTSAAEGEEYEQHESKPPATTLESRTPHVIVSDPLAARDAIERMLADKTHPAWDPSHPAHEVAEKRYLELIMLERSANPLDPEQNPVLGEVFANGQIRALGADALSPAPRPTLPEGHERDEGALVLGETEAHAMGMPPHLVMTVTDELATMIEQEEHRGAGWGREDGMAELTRWYGPEGAARVVANAQWTLEALATSEHPLLRERAQELVEDRPNDPHLTKILGVTLYEAIQNAPPSAKLEALLLRRVERQQKVEAAAWAEAAKLRQQEEAEADEARAAFMTATADAHRRWGKGEP